MLKGFSNDNVGRNNFMSRTKQMSNNFANAIGTTNTTTQKLSGCGAGGKCPTCYRCKGGTCYPAHQVVIQGQPTPTLADFNNCMGLYGTAKFDGGFANAVGGIKECEYVNEITGYTFYGQPIIKRKLVCKTSSSAKFDGGFANAGGKKKRLQFDGGFANAGGKRRRLQFDGGFDYASGSNGAGTYKDDLLDFSYADGAGGDCCVGKVCPRGSLCQTWYTQTTPTMRMKHCGCRFEDMRTK
jgi:hypothetical protein